MKLRLTQPGFETYNGQMGVIFFEEGLSTTDVREIDAIRMAAVMRCEREDGTSASVAQALLDNANTPAPVFLTGAEQHDLNAPAVEQTAVVASEASAAHTADSLAAIADVDGIKGLRLIADPMGVKATSISELITAILKAQAPAPASLG